MVTPNLWGCALFHYQLANYIPFPTGNYSVMNQQLFCYQPAVIPLQTSSYSVMNQQLFRYEPGIIPLPTGNYPLRTSSYSVTNQPLFCYQLAVIPLPTSSYSVTNCMYPNIHMFWLKCLLNAHLWWQHTRIWSISHSYWQFLRNVRWILLPLPTSLAHTTMTTTKWNWSYLAIGNRFQQICPPLSLGMWHMSRFRRASC